LRCAWVDEDGTSFAAAPAPLPNNHRQRRTKAPSCGADTGSAAGVDTGIGIMGAAEAGNMLGTKGMSPCGFLSRLPIFESSMEG
jgi:hypothetical protein